jgi:hypothetical protein
MVAVGGKQNAARIVANRNSSQHVFGGGRKIVDERLSACAYRLQQAGNVNNGDALRSCRGEENLRLVGRDGDAPR